MTADRILKIISTRPEPVFDILIEQENSDELLPIKSKVLPDSIDEDGINQLFEDFEVEVLHFQLYKKNGINPLKENIVKVTSSAKPKKETKPVNMNNAPISALSAGNNDVALQIFEMRLQSMQNENDSQKKLIDRLEAALRASEAENKKLDKENAKLERDLALVEDRNEAKRIKEEAQREREKALEESSGMNGLKGFVNEVTANEPLMDLAKAFLMSRQPQQHALPASPFADLPTQRQQFVTSYAEWLKTAPEEAANTVYTALVKLSQNPSLASKI